VSLLRAELRRISKRRLTRWMLLLVVVLMATVAIVIAWQNQKPGPAALAEAEAAAERQYQQEQVWIDPKIADCERVGAEAWGVRDCEEIVFQVEQEEMVEWFMPPAFEFRSEFPEMITVFAALLSLFAFIVGASVVGAEWRSGGMMNLLLWRPRRLQVLGSKLTALLGVLLLLGVVLGAAWTAAFWQVATYRGTTDGMTNGAWQSFGLTGIRGITLALVAGAVGFALASLGRHTAMAMGAAIAAVVVGLAGVAIVGEMLELQFFQRWMWTSYVTAWLEKSLVIQDWSAPCLTSPTTGECAVPQYEITWQVAGVGMAAVVVLLLGAAMWQMRRRDVT
jgi:ABC-2 type transport system permease protein